MSSDGVRNSALLGALAELMSDLSDLLRKEVRLAQAETVAAIKRMAGVGLWIAIAGVLGVIALLLVVQAIVFAIASLGIALHWSSLITAVIMTACAAGAFFYGRSRSGGSLVPTRAVSQVKEDLRTVREHIR